MLQLRPINNINLFERITSVDKIKSWKYIHKNIFKGKANRFKNDWTEIIIIVSGLKSFEFTIKKSIIKNTKWSIIQKVSKCF